MNIKTKDNIAVVHSDTPIITDTNSALDLMATVRYETGLSRIAIQKSAITEEFFTLSTKIAGEVLQKFVNYHTKLAIIGDFSEYKSKALKDFIYECNEGSHVFFVKDEDEAVKKLDS